MPGTYQILCKCLLLSNHCPDPGQGAQLVGALPHTPKGCVLDPWSGHIPRLWVWSLVRAHVGGNQLMLLFHVNISLSPSPSSLSKINKHILG